MITSKPAVTSEKLLNEKLLDAERHLHAAEAAYTAALGILGDREEFDSITAIHNLRAKTIGMARATNRERILANRL